MLDHDRSVVDVTTDDQLLAPSAGPVDRARDALTGRPHDPS